jgi:hypothetical protein
MFPSLLPWKTPAAYACMAASLAKKEAGEDAVAALGAIENAVT